MLDEAASRWWTPSATAAAATLGRRIRTEVVVADVRMPDPSGQGGRAALYRTMAGDRCAGASRRRGAVRAELLAGETASGLPAQGPGADVDEFTEASRVGRGGTGLDPRWFTAAARWPPPAVDALRSAKQEV